MTLVQCSRGHPNPLDNRFCSLCGEKLVTEAVQKDLILCDRYRVLQELGHGGFGRTYLAEDLNRFNEACVLKEFAPQVQGTFSLQKAEELFEREAGILYNLQHPQIPRFRELFRATLGDRSYLFLVQDYIAGDTYRQSLLQRLKQGKTFTETEIHQLFENLLPVLQYIHSVGVIHRDISPDNLIARSSDQLPVLIDFGGVKRIAAEAESQFVAPGVASPVTRLGKVGYAPKEQMQQGVVSPQSDLYALAVTALVLLTGQEPSELLHPGEATWKHLALSPGFSQILARMLAEQPGNRYPSAQEVLQALHNIDSPQGGKDSASSGDTTPPDHQTASFQGTQTIAPISEKSRWASRSFQQRWILPALLLIGLGMAWGWRDRWLPLLNRTPVVASDVTGQSALENRRQSLGINAQFLVNLTNQTFYKRYPNQEGRVLLNRPEDQQWQRAWNDIADEWLTLLEKNISPEARQKLGSYTKADREAWKQQVNQLYVGSRSLFDLTDAKFFHLFPQEQGKDFVEQPIGQIWQAIAADQVKNLQDGKTLERVQFSQGTFSKQVNGTIAPGEGRVYTANLSQGQILRLNLQAPAQSTRISLYPPRPTSTLPALLEDAPATTWTGALPQSGYYEIVVVAHADALIQYQLNLAVDNVTSAPIEATDPEAPEAKN
ncbi:MAG TPA: serine/threonine-protein kinase [Trichocoleus sp.]|jgi:serine/threonine-protein kinase